MPRLATCPGCERTLAAPRGVSTGDLVGCPECRHEFRVAELREGDADDAPLLIALDTASGAESVFDFGRTSGGSSSAHAMIGQRDVDTTSGESSGPLTPGPAGVTLVEPLADVPPAAVASPAESAPETPLGASESVFDFAPDQDDESPTAVARAAERPAGSDVVLAPEEEQPVEAIAEIATPAGDEGDAAPPESQLVAPDDVPPPLPTLPVAITGCPRCWRQVGLPAHATTGLQVTCPLCAGQFELRVVQTAAGPIDLPVVRVVGAEGADAPGAVAAEVVDETDDAHGSGFELAGLHGSAASESGDSFSVGGAALETGSVGVAARPSARRSEPNMAVMLLQVVLGGVVAILITYPILMWGFSRDPFRIAPKLPRILVPEQMEAPLEEE
jgi:hypothetical protein